MKLRNKILTFTLIWVFLHKSEQVINEQCPTMLLRFQSLPAAKSFKLLTALFIAMYAYPSFTWANVNISIHHKR